MREKLILDACCGSRMFWFDKTNPNVLFCDLRNERYDFTDRKPLEIKPDVVADFKKMPFQDNTFQMVVFDPPHRTDLTSGNWMELYYGKLSKEWQNDLKAGINECMRVLKPNGTLIFKWNKHQIPTSKVLEAIEHKPLFGHTTGKTGNTVWMAFMKFNP